jgi:tetratricopeptide (TPR) repeat protein
MGWPNTEEGNLSQIDSNHDGRGAYFSLICLLLCSALLAGFLDVRPALAASGQTPIEALHVPELDAGFHLLYELKPEEARTQFAAWQKSHPEDPLGSASEAAAYLFEECYRQGVLTSEFFLDNKRFLGKIPLKPNPKLRAAFFAADKQAQYLAQLRLKTNPDDANALFAMTLSVGMQADYASLIDKHQVESLKMIRDADRCAKKLLVIAPDAADAYLTLGAANYIIGSLPGLKKFFLGFAGIHGDKNVGIQQLEIAADHGHFLRAFAKILLALAALREKKPEVARAQLNELVAEFPENPLFASELGKLNVSRVATIRPEYRILSSRVCLSIRRTWCWCLERPWSDRIECPCDPIRVTDSGILPGNCPFLYSPLRTSLLA